MIELVRRGSKIQVRLDDGRRMKVVGEIRQVEGGYQYFPKGQKTGGDVLPTINAVRATL
jgi:hypothetical protein